LGDGLAQGAEGATELALVGAIDRGLCLCLTCALQRRNMICHSELSFARNMSGELGCRPQAGQKHSLTDPLQTLILEKIGVRVNLNHRIPGNKAPGSNSGTRGRVIETRRYFFRFILLASRS